MTKCSIPVLALASLLVLAGCGGDRPAPPDKAAIERIVHDYIFAHPEIIPEAMTAMQSHEAAKLLRDDPAEVETPFPGAVAGNPKGDVTLVEFFDYACPYCRAAHGDIKRLIAADPKLRVVYRDLGTISAESADAALIALSAAQQGRYLAFHDRMFELPGKVDRERTIAIVRAAGLDERRTAAALTDPKLKAEIRKNYDLARAIGLTSTPTFVVGDRILSGSAGYDRLVEAIAAARHGGTPIAKSAVRAGGATAG